MQCVFCGDCCLRMSPLARAGEPCPKLIQNETFFFCSDYVHRPKACKAHSFPFRFCPIGVTKLELKEPIEIAQRLDTGQDLLEEV